MIHKALAFENLIIDLLNSSKNFSHVKYHQKVNDREIDIIAKGKIDGKDELFVIEVKSFQSRINRSLIDQVYAKWLDIKESLPDSNPVLVSINGLTRSAEEKALKVNMKHWDLDILKNFVDEKLFNKLYQEYILKIESIDKPFVIQDIKKTKEDIFIDNLSKIDPGKKKWSKYQQTVYDVLEHIFCPPLESPLYELADKDARNRRDIIFENASNEGFWNSVKNDYSGHYIVIDAKNYSSGLGKRPIIDIAHYLKIYGCGLFGIIVSRKGLASAGNHARKEQWIGNKKMIIVLDDDDLIEMLKEKKKQGTPEDIIRKKISTFRMSL